MSRRVALRVQPPVPLGDVTVLPATMSGLPEADMARAIAAVRVDAEVPTAVEIYKQLRRSFPAASLSARVAALVVMERLRRAFWRAHFAG
jgi:hypothetical protein